MTDATITLSVWVGPLKQAVPANFDGRVYHVAGEDIVLFPIGVMAAAIWRQPRVIVAWEEAKLWPKPSWKVPDKKTKRWYSGPQILEAHRIHMELCEGNYGLVHSRHFRLDDFHKRVRAVFYRCDAAYVRAKGKQS